MDNKRKLALTMLSPVFWFTMLLSLSLYMAHWRMVNEPGIGSADGLKDAYRICFFFGALGTASIQATFIQHKEEGIKKVWLANIAATMVYVPIFLLTLLMMV
jgi:hypothetical protein